MKIIRCKPVRSPEKAIMLISVFAVLSLVFGAFSCVMITYKGIWQIAFIVTVGIGVNMAVRYTMTEMEYTLTADSFEVRKKIGNKVTLVCSLALSETVTLTDKTTYKENETSYGNIWRKYNFNQNVFAPSAMYLCNFNGKNILVEFEPNQTFYDCFQQRISENKK